MNIIFTGNKRRDGKYKVTLIFPGGPNMFGGCYPPKVFNKLYSAEKVRDTLKNSAIENIQNLPREFQTE